MESTTLIISRLLDRLNDGDSSARDELIARSCKRLEQMARRQLDRFPGVRRFEQAEDVVQMASMRLRKSLESLTPRSSREFFGLSAKKLREQLIDLHRHYFGPHGDGANRQTNAGGADSTRAAQVEMATAGEEGPLTAAARLEFHERVETLATDDRELIDMFWYQGLTRGEVAGALGVSEKTVSRRWRDLRMKLADWLT
jgi:RNA polymerase sigma factor (sigma-70 family)